MPPYHLSGLIQYNWRVRGHELSIVMPAATTDKQCPLTTPTYLLPVRTVDHVTQLYRQVPQVQDLALFHHSQIRPICHW